MRLGEILREDDLMPALQAAVNRRQELRRPFEAIWWNNIALIAGDHQAKWDPNRATWTDRDVTDDTSGKKPRMVINQALSVYRTELSKLTKNHPVVEVIANSDEATDLAATKVGRAVLSAVEWKFRLPALRKEIMSWVIQTGTCAHYVGWDYLNDDAGEIDYTIDPATGEPAFNPKRLKELEEMEERGDVTLDKESFPLGDLDFKVYCPFQLLPDDTCRNFAQLKDLITTEVADVDVIRSIYGKAADKIRPDTVTLGPMEERLLGRLGMAHPRNQQSEQAAEIFTWWLTPGIYTRNNYLKNGMYVRWCQGQILDVSIFPYQDRRMPFAFYQHIPAPTTIWADCVINHIRDINLEIDKTVSQLVETKDYMANPMWRIATQHRVKGKVKAVAGGILKYVHSPNIPPPEPIQGFQMPGQVENLVETLRMQILEISGQSDISRGSVPTGVRSGVAVSYLQEEDDSKIAPTVDNMEQAIAYEGSLVLERVSQYYRTKRIMRFYRRDGVFDVVKFKGADLKSNTDVISQAGSAMPKSKAARQQFTLQLVELGVLTDPNKIKEMLELGEAEPNLEDLQVAQANRENQLMLRGMSASTFDHRGDLVAEKENPVAIPVKKWHNHKLHLEQHYREMSSDEFDHLAVSNPEIVRLFDEHTGMHEAELAAAQQAEMARLEAAKGAPDGQPAGTQPTSAFTAPPPGDAAGASSAASQPTVNGQPAADASGQISNS